MISSTCAGGVTGGSFPIAYSEFGRPALAVLSATFLAYNWLKVALSAASAGLPNSLLDFIYRNPRLNYITPHENNEDSDT